jgi:hypothetical protein
MVVTLLATADSPEARAWAPVPGKLDAIATVRGKTMLFSAVGLQSSFASALRKYPRGEKPNIIAIDSETTIECFVLIAPVLLSADLFRPRVMLGRPHAGIPVKLHRAGVVRNRKISDRLNLFGELRVRFGLNWAFKRIAMVFTRV